MTILSNLFLYVLSFIDSYGAQEWNLRIVGATSAIIFLSIRMQFKKKYNIDWDALVHAWITAVGSVICCYFDANPQYIHPSSSPVIEEPMNSITNCSGPLTSFHRILASITLGYAICDIINGVSNNSKAGIVHGVATMAVMALFVEWLQAPEIIAPMLVMEISTVVLAAIKASFFGPAMLIAAQALFVLTFFVSRVVWTPYLMVVTLRVMMVHGIGSCYPEKPLFYVTLVFSIFFTGLNYYWFYLMILKVRRKLTGKEKMTDVSTGRT
mmetsp:Transcript_54/g.74  ORF Transcript_54/g.74 Transcript_54/m.74 type:complete len:268 (+) Transcript_54:70-873(+)|eukprot:CAMPEP_0194218988 /NCGR_PEP_ID=MMETSP0156-20130528/24997_1 /TAXON_ID=33649 /ORGANISM="Thalassionema nitzschioides, Strain L26-B" /LENGTH=267 /DNA_ID=CAMNT_0038948517 /DNA_START=42 /DNA_END=845 /DNA_ORIENTATION=-